jgi:uncharacterized protein involved in tolerance to divalent cations
MQKFKIIKNYVQDEYRIIEAIKSAHQTTLPELIQVPTTFW